MRGLSLPSAVRLLREPWRVVFHRAYADWLRDRGDTWRMRFSHLGPGDRVLDFGGYKGEWTAAIRATYGARVEVFEPHPGFAADIAARFAGDGAVTVNDFALAAAAGPLALSDSADGSSALAGAGVVAGRTVGVADYFARAPGRVAAAKINIEGGEYALLPALDAAGLLGQFDLIQVQFHLFTQDHIEARAAIRARLAMTHQCDWEYPFVWEQWSRRSGQP